MTEKNFSEGSNARRTRKLYAIYDEAKQAFINIMEKDNDKVAIRDFKVMANNPQSLICMAPEEFKLYELGAMDEETGELLENKRLVANAEDYKEVKNV